MASKALQRNGPACTSVEIGPLLERALRADSSARRLLAGEEFLGLVDEMAESVEAIGYEALLGASVMGHALVGAL
jgi:hypothetical protein